MPLVFSFTEAPEWFYGIIIFHEFFQFDELQEKHNTLQAEFQETFTFSSGVIDDLSQTRQAKESVMKELDRLWVLALFKF